AEPARHLADVLPLRIPILAHDVDDAVVDGVRQFNTAGIAGEVIVRPPGVLAIDVRGESAYLVIDAGVGVPGDIDAAVLLPRLALPLRPQGHGPYLVESHGRLRGIK